MSETPSKQASAFYRNLVKERAAASRALPSEGIGLPDTAPDSVVAPATGSVAATKPPPSDLTGFVEKSSVDGGGLKGENIDSLLIDTVDSNLIAPGSRSSKVRSSLGSTKSASTTPRNTSSMSFKLLLITTKTFDTICKGVISSTKNDYACAKSSNMCNTQTHSSKHTSIKRDHVYILMYSTVSTNASRKFVNPTEFNCGVDPDSYGFAKELIETANIKLYNEKGTEDDAKQAMLKFISDLMLKSYESADSDRFSTALSNESDFETIKNTTDPIEIQRMDTAKEYESDEENDRNTKPSKVNVLDLKPKAHSTISFKKDSTLTNRIENDFSVSSNDNDDDDDIDFKVISDEAWLNDFKGGIIQDTTQTGTDTKDVMKRTTVKIIETIPKSFDFMEQVSEQAKNNPLFPVVELLLAKIKNLDENVQNLEFKLKKSEIVATNSTSILESKLNRYDERLSMTQITSESCHERLDEFDETAWAKVETIQEKVFMDTWNRKYPTFFKDFGKTKLMRDIRSDINTCISHNVTDKYNTSNIVENNKHDELNTKVEGLELAITKVSSDFEIAKRELLGRPEMDAADTTSISAIESKLDVLKYQMTLMDSRIGQSFLKFGNITLKSYADTLFFVKDNICSNSFGCFFDMVALMNSLRETHIDEKTYLESLHNAQKTKFLSITEVSTSTSFLHVTPSVFCVQGKQQDSFALHGSIDKMLPMVKQRSYWYSQGGMFGLKRDLDRNIQSKVAALDADIRDTLGDGQGADLAREYLRASHLCYTDFVSWTENFFYELQAMTEVSEAEAWNLILECWLAFFIDLRKIRMDCSSLSLAGLDVSSERRKEIVAKYIWTMGRAIHLQNEYREKQFRNHPTISSVINFYLFQHKVPLSSFNSIVSKLKDELKSLTSWRSSATRDISKALKSS
jgi:hypothetical protein